MSIDHRPNLARCDDTTDSRDIVFLPRHELRNKITTRNWNYPRITIAPTGRSQACLRIDVYGSEGAGRANGHGARTNLFWSVRRVPKRVFASGDSHCEEQREKRTLQFSTTRDNRDGFLFKISPARSATNERKKESRPLKEDSPSR